MSSGVIVSYGRLDGVIRNPSPERTERLPAVPWFMPLEFMRRQIATISSRSALLVIVFAFLSAIVSPGLSRCD